MVVICNLLPNQFAYTYALNWSYFCLEYPVQNSNVDTGNAPNTAANHPATPHEQIRVIEDRASGLKAVIAIHSTALGPAAGGCRRWKYASMQQAIDDAKRLSTGMTYKNALAGIGFGGGKSVIMADSNVKPTALQLQKFANCLNELKGRYITAEDVGMGVGQMVSMAQHTKFVSGIGVGGIGGDPSPKTAQGVFIGLEAAAQYQFGIDSLQGLRVVVQGLGNVGFALCERLAAAGVSLFVCDLEVKRVRHAEHKFGAQAVSLQRVLSTAADIFVPCALGGVITEAVAETLPVAMVAGAANNQLANENSGEILLQRGVQYVPDFVLNAGGVISIAHEYHVTRSAGANADGSNDVNNTPDSSLGEKWVSDRISEIPQRAISILEVARNTGCTPDAVARRLALEIVNAARQSRPLHPAHAA